MGRDLSNFEIESITRAAYEVNRSFSQQLGDFSHVPYEALPDDLKQVARHATLGIANHDHNARLSHQSWLNLKRIQGWTFGSTKDPIAKTHPCLVEWENLSFEQQAKDELWVSTVKNILSAMFRIPRQ